MNVQNQMLGDGVAATSVERPNSVEELQELVKRSVAEGQALYPRGGGTSLEFGGIPRKPGIAVETRGLAKVIDYPAADMTITVESGMTLAELATILDREGQRLTIDPPQVDRATVGGVFATNASGPRRYGVGRPRDQVIGLSFVTSNGEVIKGGGRVVKNVAGYDFPRLLTGSMGTLGILSQFTLKVRPKPEASALVWAQIDEIDQLSDMLDSLNVSETRPVAIELLNRSAAESVGKDLNLDPATWVLALGFEDNAASVNWQLAKILEELGAYRSARLEGESAQKLWSRLVEFPADTQATLSFEAHVPPSDAAAFAEVVDPGIWSLQGHAGSGIFLGHLQVEFDHAKATEEIHKLRGAAVGFGGSLILPRCPTDWKADLRVWGYPRPDWIWCERLKKTLDPAGALNPGKFVGNI